MNVYTTARAMRDWCRAEQRAGRTVGFAPTMGALHAGHVSLMDAARRECDSVAVSIFVNPTQFAPHEDLTKYPRPMEADLEACRAAGVDAVFTPSVAEMYRPDAATFVELPSLSTMWEGAVRPTHFRGVATVVTKLFQIVPADASYFGQKDFQQQLVIRKMVRDLDIPMSIRVCPIIRDADGLALSSRNVYLSPDERRAALAIPRSLVAAHDAVANGERSIASLKELMRRELTQSDRLSVDYATLVDPDTLAELTEWSDDVAAIVAARSGATRLLDNAVLAGDPFGRLPR